MPPWLTPTAADLMAAIDDTRAYDRLPVLADALEDGGCDDRPLLDWLRAGPGDPDVRPYYRRAVEGHATVAGLAEAVAWLTGFAAEIGDHYPNCETFAGLMESCRAKLTDDDHWEMSYGRNTPDAAIDGVADLWRHYETLTGLRPAEPGWHVRMRLEDSEEGDPSPERYAPSLFSCSC